MLIAEWQAKGKGPNFDNPDIGKLTDDILRKTRLQKTRQGEFLSMGGWRTTEGTNVGEITCFPLLTPQVDGSHDWDTP